MKQKNRLQRFRCLRSLILLAVTASAISLAAQDSPPPPPPVASQQNSGPSFTLKMNSDIVLTNVVVRDKKTGEVVRGLTEKDFAILENGKPQKIDSFDFQSVDMAAPLNEATVSGSSGPIVLGKTAVVSNEQQLRNHRLIVLFFDLSSMQVEDIDRSVGAARDYVNKTMQPADLVAV